jgi:hypothetical protein
MRSVFIALLVACSGALAAEPAQLLLVGTYHMSNPGADLANIEADDVLAPARQKQIEAVVDALARFRPERVFVEWPAQLVNERYAKYRGGTLAPSRNEVVQLGFRLARRERLDAVNGVDVDGDFPFDKVQEWARAHGRAADLDALLEEAKRETGRIDELQARTTIGGVLREMNKPAALARNWSFYPALLAFGSGDDQPGSALLSAWIARNNTICARIVQALKPGEHAVVFFGQGHIPPLKRCLEEAPGVRLADPLAYLAQ